jgi:hypothetical protein
MPEQAAQNRKAKQNAKQLAYVLHILQANARGCSPCCEQPYCAATRRVMESQKTALEGEALAKVKYLQRLLAHYMAQQGTLQGDYVCSTALKLIPYISLEAWQATHVLQAGPGAARVRETAALHGVGVSDEARAMAHAAARAHVKAMLARLVPMAKHRKACCEQALHVPPCTAHFEEWQAAHCAQREKRQLWHEQAVVQQHKRKRAALTEEEIGAKVAIALEKELPRGEVGQQQAAFATPQRRMRAARMLPPAVGVQDVLTLLEQCANVTLPRTQFAVKQYETDANGRDRRREIAEARAAARRSVLAAL